MPIGPNPYTGMLIADAILLIGMILLGIFIWMIVNKLFRNMLKKIGKEKEFKEEQTDINNGRTNKE